MEALITKEDIITAKTNVSTNIEDQSFDTAINDAQILDIRPILGNAFYLDVVDKLLGSPIPQVYTDLLDGVKYIDECDDEVRFYGLKLVIINFAYARLIENNNNFFTRAGSKRKNSSSSETISTGDLTSWINRARSKAIAYQEDLLKFLCTKSDDYPIYKVNKTLPRKGSILIRSSKIHTRY